MSRRPSSRRRLTTVLVAVGTTSVVLLVAVLTLMANSMLSLAAERQLTSVGDGRRAAVEHGVQELQASVGAMAADPGVVAAVADLTRTWPSLDEDLTAAEQQELSELYTTTGDPGRAAADLAPPSPEGRRAQYLYLATNPFPPDERARLDDAGDGSDYSAAHATHHAFLGELLASSQGSDLLVVSPDQQRVVYSVRKRIDFGDDVGTSSPADTGLASVVARLPAVPIGDAVVVDSTPLAAANSAPTAFVAATVRSGSEALGALVMTVPVSDLTDLVSADGQWDRLGLGPTGDAAVVGSDGTLRTEPRAWSSDRADYLERLAGGDDDGAVEATEIDRAGSPVLVHDVSNPAVDAALAGDDYIGTVRGVLGGRVRMAAAPIEAGGLGWVVVTSQSTSEAWATIRAFLGWVGLLLAVLVPLIVLAAVILSRALTRPIPSLVAVSSAVAGGNLDVAVPDLGRNEFGDLARRLGAVAHELRRQRAAVDAEEERIQGILSAVVPARLMERVRRGEHTFSDVLDTATVVSVSLVDVPDPSGADQDTVLEATARIVGDLEDLAARHGLEAVRAAARQESFLAGLGSPDPEVETAATFAAAVAETVRAAGRDFGLEVDASVGMAAGTVTTGLVGSTQVAFGVWGDPPGRAAALDGLARAGEVLVDTSIVSALGDGWITKPVEDVIGLSDDVIDTHVLIGPSTGMPPSERA